MTDGRSAEQRRAGRAAVYGAAGTLAVFGVVLMFISSIWIGVMAIVIAGLSLFIGTRR